MDKYTTGTSATARQAAIPGRRSGPGRHSWVVRSARHRGPRVSILATSPSHHQGRRVYRLAPAAGAPADPEAPLRSSVLRAQAAGANLVVIRCEAGMAPRVGLVLDGMTFPGIIGTLAGDDTVFIAVDSSAANKRLVDFLQSRIPRS